MRRLRGGLAGGRRLLGRRSDRLAAASGSLSSPPEQPLSSRIAAPATASLTPGPPRACRSARVAASSAAGRNVIGWRPVSLVKTSKRAGVSGSVAALRPRSAISTWPGSSTSTYTVAAWPASIFWAPGWEAKKRRTTGAGRGLGPRCRRDGRRLLLLGRRRRDGPERLGRGRVAPGARHGRRHGGEAEHDREQQQGAAQVHAPDYQGQRRRAPISAGMTRSQSRRWRAAAVRARGAVAGWIPGAGRGRPGMPAPFNPSRSSPPRPRRSRRVSRLRPATAADVAARVPEVRRELRQGPLERLVAVPGYTDDTHPLAGDLQPRRHRASSRCTSSGRTGACSRSGPGRRWTSCWRGRGSDKTGGALNKAWIWIPLCVLFVAPVLRPAPPVAAAPPGPARAARVRRRAAALQRRQARRLGAGRLSGAAATCSCACCWRGSGRASARSR